MNASSCIQRLRETFPQFCESYNKFLELYNKKLWYQLSVELLAFTQNEENYVDNNMIQLYDGFIVNCESRFDSTEYSMLVCNISRQYYPDYANTLEFIKKIGDVGEPKTVFRKHVHESSKVVSHDKSKLARRDVIGELAFARYVLEVAWLHIRLEQTDLVQEYLDEVKSLLDNQPTPPSRLYSIYYRVSVELFRCLNDVDNIYKSSVKWLAYTPLSSMTNEDKGVIVQDMIKCALLSHEVYSFGELLTEEIHMIATQSKYPWLYELLSLVNKGEVGKWNEAKELYKSYMINDKSFQGKLEIIDEKVALLALLELVFHKPTTERSLLFTEIAECCVIDIAKIEQFLIHGANLGLFKCKINQIQQRVVFTWLKPRILDGEQLQTMNRMMNTWSQQIHNTLLFVTKAASDN